MTDHPLLLKPFTGNYSVSQTFSQHPGYGKGTDWAMPNGTALCACRDGRVVDVVDKYAANDNNKSYGYGNRVKLDIGGGYVVFYAHLMPGIPVAVGDLVKIGTFIAYSDNTGWSTNDHLHFETRYNNVPYDHYSYLRSTIEEVIGMPPVIPTFPEQVLVKVTATPYLNIRHSNSIKARDVGDIPNGTVLPVFGVITNTEGTWLKIGYNQYCAMKYGADTYAEWVLALD